MSQATLATALVVPFEQLRMNDVADVGGKNASLGEMISQLATAGVRVPGERDALPLRGGADSGKREQPGHRAGEEVLRPRRFARPAPEVELFGRHHDEAGRGSLFALHRAECSEARDAVDADQEQRLAEMRPTDERSEVDVPRRTRHDEQRGQPLLGQEGGKHRANGTGEPRHQAPPPTHCTTPKGVRRCD